MVPVLPSDDVPVLKDNAPLIPDVPASVVRTETTPELAAIPDPDDKDMNPPDNVFDEPPKKFIFPASTPSPLVRTMSPLCPAPPDASPDFS